MRIDGDGGVGAVGAVGAVLCVGLTLIAGAVGAVMTGVAVAMGG